MSFARGSLVIKVEGNDSLSFCDPGKDPHAFSAEELRRLLVTSGLWCAFRTRPYGKIPKISSEPASLFITAMDSAPLGPNMSQIIDDQQDNFRTGLKTVAALTKKPVYICQSDDYIDPIDQGDCGDQVEQVIFDGPNPASLPSTHIHFLDPVHEGKIAWHIGAQEVSAIGGLLRTGRLCSERIVALAGPSVNNPRYIRTIVGAAIDEICDGELVSGEDARMLSGSVLDGRQSNPVHGFLGRYHQQISCLPEGDGRQFFGWLRPGKERFSTTRAFWSAFLKPKKFPFNTAVWGGDRSIFPLGTYEEVMPLDIIATYFLKSLASGNSERAKELGCLEVIEEDLALCSYVCPGKNEFGPMLRQTLTSIEQEG